MAFKKIYLQNQDKRTAIQKFHLSGTGSSSFVLQVNITEKKATSTQIIQDQRWITN